MSEEDKEVVMGYETLYEFLRREKNREEVQKLPENFVKDVNEYIGGLRQSLNNKKREVSHFEGDEIRKEETRLNNLIGLVSDLYQKRERKIISMAITKSRTGAKLADVAQLTSEEKEFYNSLVSTLDYYKETIYKRLIALDPASDIKKPELPENPHGSQGAKLSAGNAQQQQPQQNPKGQGSHQNNQSTAPTSTPKCMVRFLHAVPKFYDNDMNVLGPFEEDDIANLPLPIVEILKKKGRVEEIKKG